MAQNESQRGFASMDPEEQHEIASKGGHAAQESGHAHKLTDEERREGGEKGGRATAERYGPDYYSEIGKKGGQSRAGNDDLDLTL